MVRHASASRTAVWLVELHSSNQRCCWVDRLCVIAKIYEWIDPAYSVNLLARAYDALKEWWLLLWYYFGKLSAGVIRFFFFFFFFFFKMILTNHHKGITYFCVVFNGLNKTYNEWKTKVLFWPVLSQCLSAFTYSKFISITAFGWTHKKSSCLLIKTNKQTNYHWIRMLMS